jgi:hypothetical protein
MMSATETPNHNQPPASFELPNHGLNEEEILAQPVDVRYGLALESEALQQRFSSPVEIEAEIERQTGLTQDEQREARKIILGHGDTQGMTLDKNEEGMTLLLTVAGRHKLSEKIEHFKQHGS